MTKIRKNLCELDGPGLLERDVDIATGFMANERSAREVAGHLIRLSNLASSKGRRDAADLLERWALNPPTGETLHQSWALFTLLTSGFYRNAERAFLGCLQAPNKREALLNLVSGEQPMPSECGAMLLVMPDNELQEIKRVLTGQCPDVDPVQALEPIFLGHVSAVHRFRKQTLAEYVWD